MKNLTITLCLTFAVLLGSAGMSWSADFQKGLAAEQGIAFAQGNLGVMYGTGRGVIQDNVYAHMWLNIAASQGDKNAVKNRDIVAKRMNSTDISAAQKLARECVRKKYKGC